MRLLSPHTHLFVRRKRGDSEYSVEVVASQGTAVKAWNSSARISPIYRVEERGIQSPENYSFPGRQHLIFLSTVRSTLHPELLLGVIPPQAKVWLSLGLYNCILVVRSERDVKPVLAFADSEGLDYEVWFLDKGKIARVSLSKNSTHTKSCKTLSEDTVSFGIPEFDEVLSEYRPLMAATVSRAAALPEVLQQELMAIIDAVSEMLKRFHKNPKVWRYQALAHLMTINAGLSRFSSQTFAGASPILHTECHFWSHSLLGIGVATLAVWNIRRFLHRTLAKVRLPEQFAKIAEHTKDVPDLSGYAAFPQGPWIKTDFEETTEGLSPIVPLVCYFSARDGYKATHWGISAPLAAVAACNSRRWSLMTLTHEVSHVIIRAVLGDLYPVTIPPTEAWESDVDAAYKLLDGSEPAPNLLMEVRRILLNSIVMMECAEAGRPLEQADLPTRDEFKNMLVHTFHDIDETMTHTLDFLYFYGRDVEKYVSCIWSSWGTIPNVSNRVPEYVVRTISAVLSVHLKRGENAESSAMKQVKTALRKLKQNGGRYVDEALSYIDKRWDDEIEPCVIARCELIRIVKTFLYSDDVSHMVRHEPHISGGAPEREGYTLEPLELTDSPIRNPLRFLEFYTGDASSDATLSAWMLYVLAFCVEVE